MSATLPYIFQCKNNPLSIRIFQAPGEVSISPANRTSAFSSVIHLIFPFLNPDPYPSGSTEPYGSGLGFGCKRIYLTLAVLQPTYISSCGLVMCLGCAAAAPTGAAVTGVVLLLKNTLIMDKNAACII